MHVLVVYSGLAAVPALAMLGATRALERWCGRYPTRPSRRASAVGPSLERLVADLRRLEQDFRRIRASDEPGRVSRMRTVTLAYDDVLRACCRSVGLPEPSDPLSSIDRLHTEAALAQQGLTW